jgi:putative membrane protein
MGKEGARPPAADGGGGTDPRNELAADRTVFAAERTYAAWVRTGLAALASGVGAQKLLLGTVPHWMLAVLVTILVAYSAFCFAAAVWREIYAGPPRPRPDARRLPRVVLVLVNGFLMLVAAAILVGFWIGGAG